MEGKRTCNRMNPIHQPVKLKSYNFYVECPLFNIFNNQAVKVP